jgi:hypothetical protein
MDSVAEMKEYNTTVDSEKKDYPNEMKETIQKNIMEKNVDNVENIVVRKYNTVLYDA